MSESENISIEALADRLEDAGEPYGEDITSAVDALRAMGKKIDEQAAEIARLRAEVQVAKDQATRRFEWFDWVQANMKGTPGHFYDDIAKAEIIRLRADAATMAEELAFIRKSWKGEHEDGGLAWWNTNHSEVEEYGKLSDATDASGALARYLGAARNPATAKGAAHAGEKGAANGK